MKADKEEKFVREDETTIFFSRDVLLAIPSKRVELRDVLIPGNDFVSAFLTITNDGVLEAGSEYRFDVLQMVKKNVVGGSTFLISIKGEEKNSPVSLKGDLDPEKDVKDQEQFNVLPRDLRDAARERLKEYLY